MGRGRGGRLRGGLEVCDWSKAGGVGRWGGGNWGMLHRPLPRNQGRWKGVGEGEEKRGREKGYEYN